MDISFDLESKFEAMRRHPSQFNMSEPKFVERMRTRARDAAKGQPYEYGEAFKLVQIEL